MVAVDYTLPGMGLVMVRCLAFTGAVRVLCRAKDAVAAFKDIAEASTGLALLVVA
jgi:hypothetical protein